MNNLNSVFSKKTVLITGGTGYLGNLLLKNLINTEVNKIIIYSRDEFKQSEMKKVYNDKRIRYFIGDVRDGERLNMASRGVNIIIHSAAMKRIESCEYDPIEAIKTNVYGTENVIKSALYNKIDIVLNVSTDKAVNPSCLYGATKQLAEKLIVDANNYSDGQCKFINIRCGNFINSTGSIFPLFKKLVSDGVDKLPLTSPLMDRFIMTEKDILDLINFALIDEMRGVTYIKKLNAFKIIDLIFAYNKQCAIIGERPGEKQSEDMISEYENTIELDNYYLIYPEKQEDSKYMTLKSNQNKYLSIQEIKKLIEV